MKLTLVNIWRGTYPNLGLGYLASYLDHYCTRCKITIIDENDTKIAISKIVKSKPDVVGYTAFTPNYYDVETTAKLVKNILRIPALLGGPHISSLPETLSPIFDIGVIGEGEETLLKLVKLFNSEKVFKGEKLERIEGIVFHQGSKNRVNPHRKLIDPIDKIPPPKRELFDMQFYLKPKNILCDNKLICGASIITSRGCPYRCVYCQASAMWKKIRLHSAKYVVEEIYHLYKEYKVEGICIADDLFITDISRISQIVSGLKNKKILGKIKYLIDGRANLINNNLLKILKEMGVVQIAIGFESASEKILHYLKRGTVTLKQNKQVIPLIRKYGIDIYAQFMIGTPGETTKDIMQTLNFIKENNLTHSHLSITTPLPGTELWEYCKREGIVDESKIDWKKFNMQTSSRLKDHFYINKKIPYDEFNRLFDRFNEELALLSIKEKSKLSLINYKNFKTFLKNPKLVSKIIYGSISNLFKQEIWQRSLK